MSDSSALKIGRGAALGFSSALILGALSSSVLAEDIPKFSSPEINAFVAKYVGIIDAYNLFWSKADGSTATTEP